MQQSQDLARARQLIEHMLGGKVEPPARDSKSSSEKSRPSPTKAKVDVKSHFSEPPAPPPQVPLPEKPDVAQALADPLIRPLLRRDDGTLPQSASSSPTRTDHSSDILRLCEELKLAKGELSTQSERMKNLENELQEERRARESAEERAQGLHRRDSPTKDSEHEAHGLDRAVSPTSPPDLQTQLDRLRVSMDEMKQQMELYRQRAESAENERDEARHSLAEMVEQKRKENSDGSVSSSPRPAASPKRPTSSSSKNPAINGHAVGPAPSTPTSNALLERAGVEEGQPITLEQAKAITQLLSREVLQSERATEGDNAMAYYGRPYGSAAAVVILGVLVMSWVNGWPKIDR